MRGLLAAITAAFLLPGEESVPRIEVDDLKRALEANAVLVLDVRDDAAYAAGHVAGAVSIPERELEARLPRLKAEKRPIVTYCT